MGCSRATQHTIQTPVQPSKMPMVKPVSTLASKANCRTHSAKCSDMMLAGPIHLVQKGNSDGAIDFEMSGCFFTYRSYSHAVPPEVLFQIVQTSACPMPNMCNALNCSLVHLQLVYTTTITCYDLKKELDCAKRTRCLATRRVKGIKDLPCAENFS